MGSFQANRRANEAIALINEYQRKKDAEFPLMDRPCGTPGAVYSVMVEGNTLALGVTLPFNIEQSLPPEARERLKAAMHDAVLPIVEQFYRDVWLHTIAGKVIDDTGPMPSKWGLLFKKWIRRCWQRGEIDPRLPGRGSWKAQNWYQLPEEYQWDDPSRQDLRDTNDPTLNPR